MKTQTIHGILTGPSYQIYGGNGKNNAAIVRAKFPNVKTVSDSHQPIQIELTDKDIRMATPGDHTCCAFAIASRRCWKADGAYIGIETSYLVFGNHAIRFSTPATVARETTSYDRAKMAAPGLFRLSAVRPCRRLGQRPRGTDTKLNRPKKKRREGMAFGEGVQSKSGDPRARTRMIRAYQWEDDDLRAAA